MVMSLKVYLLAAALVLFLFLRTSSAAAAVLLNGSGSTFMYPIESAWTGVYEKVSPDVHINYQPIGSGAGIAQLIQQHTDFAGSDAPLTDKQLALAPGKILHFPAALGADVVVYNLPGVAPGPKLRLTGAVIADIFRGKITKWNDPAITNLNRSLKLPSRDIVPCHRSDGSGTTYIFSDYLSKVSPEWNRDIGKGTSVKWPLGTEAPGNEGVATLVKQTPGAIGYVELTYAANMELPFAAIQNAAGQWIDADMKSVTIAAHNSLASLPADFRGSITAAPGAGAYPISSYTYFLAYEQQTDRAKGEALRNFLLWVLRDGQTYARQLKYAPLPGMVIEREQAQIERIRLPAQ
jgi:phosphate transport system substrate-binding protein